MCSDDPRMMSKKTKYKGRCRELQRCSPHTPRRPFSKVMITKCDAPLFQKTSDVHQLALLAKWQIHIHKRNFFFFHGDSAEGSSSETWERWGRLRGALGFVLQAQADSALVLARRLLAEMCRHFTCSVFCLELTSYRNNLKLEWGWEEVQIQCLILENAQLHPPTGEKLD